MTTVPRHFEEDFEFPEHCDHCPRVLSPGTEYQRVQFVVDGENSIVGSTRRVMVEHSFELVLCKDCATRLGTWLRTPLSVVADDGEGPLELDDAELVDELEKELFILGDGKLGSSEARKPGSKEDPDPACVLASFPASALPKPCLDPDKMLGASDQFPGSDYEEEKLR